MTRVQAFLLLFSALVYGATTIPVVIKESSPNGESIIAISSSNPEVEKYIVDYATRHAKQNDEPVVQGRSAYSSASSSGSGKGNVVQSFSISTPERTVAGTGRSFGDDSYTNPFFVPYLSADIDEFDINRWLKSLEKFYDPSFAGGGSSVSATAINDNGHFYGKVQTSNPDTKYQRP